MSVAFVHKISTRYPTKGGASTFFLVMCSLFLLCNCNTPGTLSMEEQDDPRCGFFPMGAKCTPEYLSLWKDNRALGERLSSTMAKNEDLASSITGVEAQLTSCTGNYEALGNAFKESKSELSRLKNPYTFTQKDAYVGAGGAVLGTMGLWMCQKMLGTKKREERHKEMSEIKENLENLEKKTDFIDTLAKSTHEMALLTSKFAQNTDKKAEQAIEVASRAETASKAGVPTHIIPQQDNGR